MSNIINQTGASLPPAPAKMQERRQAGTSLANNFQAGVQDSFPVISIKGKTWAFRFQGNTMHHVDRQGNAIPYLDVVLVNASPAIAKVFYLKGYKDGDQAPPDCWSIDGVKPDPSVPARQSPTCPGCYMNTFGSKITPAGKKAKACQDSRRVAVALPHDLPGGQVGPVMLRVPQSSLKNLKEYTAFLNAHGYDPNGCVTRMTFIVEEAYPKIRFTFHQPLTDDQYAKVTQLENDDRTARILSAPITGASSEELDEESEGHVVQAQAQAQAAQAPPPPPPPPAPPPAQAPPPPPQSRAPAASQSPLAGALAAAAADEVPPPAMPTGGPSLGGPMAGANVVSLPGLQPAEPEPAKPRGRRPRQAENGAQPAQPAQVADAAPGLENILASMLPPG